VNNPYHVAFVCHNASLLAFLNGNLLTPNIYQFYISSVFSNASFLIGGGDSVYGLLPFNGNIDEFRVSLGIARWTANFTPPTSAYPYTYNAPYTETLQTTTNTPYWLNSQAQLSWSNDGGHTWSNDYQASVGAIGQYKTRLIWRRLGYARDRVFRVAFSEPTKTVLIGAVMEGGE
jgi:hypothetical protein